MCIFIFSAVDWFEDSLLQGTRTMYLDVPAMFCTE